MVSWESVVITGLSIMLILFHLIGIYLLRQEENYGPRLFLMSLSASEIYRAVLSTINSNAGDIEIIPYLGQTSKNPYFFSMIFLTLDRFLEIYYHMKYCGTWFYKNKLKILVKI